MTDKPSTYWSERLEQADKRLKEQQLQIAQNTIVAGLEMAFQVTGSGLQAIEVGEAAVSAWLAERNAKIASEVEAIETAGSA